MNVNMALPNITPLAVNPPTEAARHDNQQRPQIAPLSEMAANANGRQVASDHDRTPFTPIKSNSNQSARSESNVQINERQGSQERQQSSAENSEQGNGHEQQRSPFSNISLDALLSRAKASQHQDRDYYHRAPVGAPSTPDEVKAMRLRNQVIANRYQSSYQIPPPAEMTVTI
ncbi:hypothetical protein [Celerinatantimonas yamalensis]|uniref:SprA family protein n=1 Tax=Celerinatantimonas yamalensis TaxID=559956 RepID=A0ABW9G9K1_9GAMM